MSRKSKTAVAIASSLALTGVEATADIVTMPEEAGFIEEAEIWEVETLILGAGDDDLSLLPLIEAADDVGFDERYAQTWGGGVGNDGLMTAPGGRNGRITPKPTVVDGVSRPARVNRGTTKKVTTPKLRTPKSGAKTLRKSGRKKKR